MAKKVVNIRLEESVWHKAKVDALRQRVTLQEWIAYLIVSAGSGVVEKDTVGVGGGH